MRQCFGTRTLPSSKHNLLPATQIRLNQTECSSVTEYPMIAIISILLLVSIPSIPADVSINLLDEGLCNASAPVFHCDSVTCVTQDLLCNGLPDCPSAQDEGVDQCGCLANEFRCSNSCVALVRRCDRVKDCPQGEDELDCKTFLCPATHFKCDNHFCVPLHSVCDFRDDCGDDSDETSCSHRSCWHSEFRCNNGECLRPGSLCDGVFDCQDLSDETDCGPDSFADCEDGTKVHRYYWCDGWPHCTQNHADELNCKECNSSDEFRCPNGRCIRRANVCDSQCDCVVNATDSSCADEVDCGHVYSVDYGVAVCELGVALGCFAPPLPQNAGKVRCIQPQYLCDGSNDCHNGNFLSDEFGCGKYDNRNFKSLVKRTEISNRVTEVAANFRCLDGRKMPVITRCDKKIDCLHGDDELNCPDMKCNETQFTCLSGQCIDLSLRCDLVYHCYDRSDEHNCHDTPCPPATQRCLLGGQCLQETKWCDYYLDCLDGSDEANCSTVPCQPRDFACDNGQCVSGHLRCYSDGKSRSGCADNSHLKNCKNWTCSEDQFKCRSGPCVSRTLLCDNNIDCPETWDDEDFCPFQCSRLLPQCECQDVHINCTARGLTDVPADAEPEITWFYLGSNKLNETLNNSSFLQLARLLYLDLSNNSVTQLPPSMFVSLWRLTVLDLHDNQLTWLANGTFNGLASLNGLHLQGNKIEAIESYAFYGLTSLKTLDLSNQRVCDIQPDAFVGLRSLTGLDLSSNQISHLNQGVFSGMPHLLFLDISKNHIRVIEANVFRSTPSLDKLVTDEFRFCCLARHTSLCLPPPDEFSSCEDLMSNLVLRLCVWLLAGVATVGNILVIVWRTRYTHCNQVHSLLITNLALGDLLMGSYLLLIALVDRHYRGVYFIHDSAWRSSRLCALAGFLSTFSSEISVFTLTVITLDRFLVIIFPFRVRRLEMARTRRLMVFGWALAGLLSALPLAHLEYFHNFYGRSGVCLALHITPDKPNGWEYSVFVFLFLNMVSFGIIALGYLWMFVAARTTQLAVSGASRRTTESAMAWRMTLLVATDAACWVPIIVLGLASLAGFTVPPQVFAWVAVFVLPLNAALNPVLYTLSTAPFLTPALLKFRRSCKLNNYSPNCTLTRKYGSARSSEFSNNSVTKRTSIRWHSRVDTAVSEHGEVVPLSRLVT
ncbi:G-protein coupled receptor GRL101-like [Macrosteles quadrilineatus]|uniref:G-protein coupled receptor GRL101-like n=1 Tax=Macrosteles quadrilineatus TaxID=74068 RepID=UPI0023E18CB7|nr:G-protein coupled receptor GRL101-like [Macrosteles quadrilineatus]